MKAGTSISRALLVLVCSAALAGCAAGGRQVSDQDAAQANLNLGIGYLRQGRPELAVERLERALDQNPRLAAAHSTLALAYDQLGDPDSAEEHYRRAARLQPSDPNVANGYAVFLCRQNRWHEAEPFFRRAASNPTYPTPAAALTNAGLCASSAGEAERAEEYFREALARDPRFPDALAALMDLSYRQQNYLQARAFMQRYLDTRPATPAILLMCFNIERELDNGAAAERCAQQLREQFPESAELAQLRQFERNAR